MRILLVDDNEKSLTFHKRLFERKGFEIETATNGIEGLAVAKEKVPDIVISDILMPEMDGFTFCKNWNEDEILKEVPFVFYTAVFTAEEDEKFAYALGARAFIRKPIDTELFLKKVNLLFLSPGKREFPERIDDPEKLFDFYKRYSSRLQKVLEDKIEELESYKELNAKLEEQKKYYNKKYQLLKKDVFGTFEAMSFLIALHRKGKIIYANKAGKEAVRASKENPIEGKKLSEVVHHDSLLNVQERIMRLTKKKENLEPSIERLLRLDGTYFDAEVQAFVISSTEEPTYLVIAKDVSESYRAERILNAVREAGEKLIRAKTLEDIFNIVANELLKVDVATVLLTVHESKPDYLITKYVKYNSSKFQFIFSLFGKKFLEFKIKLDDIDPDYLFRKGRKTKYRKDFIPLIEKIFDKSKISIAMKIVEGINIKTSITAPVFVEDEFKGLLVFKSNELKEKDTEVFASLANQFSLAWKNILSLEKLKDSEAFYKAITETTSTAIFIYSGDKFVYINKAMEEITGYSLEELLKIKFWEIVAPEHRELIMERGLARQRGEKVPDSYNFKVMRKDGTSLWVHFTARKITWRDNNASLGTAIDITDIIEQNETK